MAKSLINPGFLVFFSTLVKSNYNIQGNFFFLCILSFMLILVDNEDSNVLILQSFYQDSQKIYINKRFSDVSHVNN